MPICEYDFTDFTSLDASVPHPNASTLPQEILDSAIVATLLGVQVLTGDDIVEIEFAATPSAGDKSILDALVAAHTGLDPEGEGPPSGSERFRSVSTIAAAKALTLWDECDVLFIHDLYSMFAFDVNSTATNDNVRVIQPDNAAGAGRWIRYQTRDGQNTAMIFGNGNPNNVPHQVTAETGREFHDNTTGIIYKQIATPSGSTWVVI